MLRSIALTAGLLAALPAMAGEMGADEARRFVIGKMFSYTCFEGTRGQGRVNVDGSVAGTIQFQGSGAVRYAQLAGQHAAGTRRVRLRDTARHDVPTVLQPRAHKRHHLPRIDFGAWASPTANLHGMAHDGRGPQRAPSDQLAAARSAPFDRRRQ